MKTNKSFTKRIKVTKNGKLVARKPGPNHFNARQTGRQRLARKRTNTLANLLGPRDMARFLPGNGGKKAKVTTEASKESND
jgi:ribosomal protein L35